MEKGLSLRKKQTHRFHKNTAVILTLGSNHCGNFFASGGPCREHVISPVKRGGSTFTSLVHPPSFGIRGPMYFFLMTLRFTSIIRAVIRHYPSGEISKPLISSMRIATPSVPSSMEAWSRSHISTMPPIIEKMERDACLGLTLRVTFPSPINFS